MKAPGPVLLLPLRLEIRHDSAVRRAMIRWYPDECQICPEDGKSWLLEEFLSNNFELTAFPRRVSLLTMDPTGRVEQIAEGAEIYNPDLSAEVRKIAAMFPQNLRLDESNRLTFKNMTADFWNNLLKYVTGTANIFKEIFGTFQQLALDIPPVRLTKESYPQVKNQLTANKVTVFEFDDMGATIRLKDVPTTAQIQALSALLKVPELKSLLAAFLDKQKSVSIARFLYGVFPPRFGSWNDISTQWITDYSIAEKAGMAITIDDAAKDGKYPRLLAAEWLIAVGYREDGAGVPEKILRAHKTAKRFKILRPGEPTNNTSQEKAASFASGGSPAKPPIGVKTNGELLTQYLGLPADLLSDVENADRVEIDIVRQVNAVLWPACVANYPYPDFLPGYRDFFVNSVTGRGHLPSVRIGENPYGFALTSSPGLCDTSPVFTLLARPIVPPPRSRLIRLAESHGRYLNTQGKSVEALWAEYKQNPLTRSFFDYVLFLRNETVFSEAESDYDRLENILRQNAVPRRIDLEVAGGDTPTHYRSRDHLLLEPGVDKSVLIRFLTGVKDLLHSNALFLRLLLLEANDFNSLKDILSRLSGRMDLLAKLFELLRGNAPYKGIDLTGYGTAISGFYAQLEAMLGYSNSKDLAEFDIRVDRLSLAIDKQQQEIADALSGVRSGMLSALQQLNAFRPQIAQSGDDPAKPGGIIQKLTPNYTSIGGKIRTYMTANGLDEKTQSFVLGKIPPQPGWIGDASMGHADFARAFADINARALSSIGLYGATTVDQYGIGSDPLRAAPVFDAMLNHPRSILAHFAADRPLGKDLRSNAKKARDAQASQLALTTCKNNFDKAVGEIKFPCSKPVLISFEKTVTNLIGKYDFTVLEKAANALAFKGQVVAIGNAGKTFYSGRNADLQKDFDNSVRSVKAIVQGQSVNFSRQTLQTGLSTLKPITDAMSAISGNLKAYDDSRLQANFSKFGQLPDRISELAGFFQNLEMYLPLLVVWKKSRMPMLQRMVLLSALYASQKQSLVHTTTAEMEQGVNALIDWLGRDGVDAQDLETMMLEVLDCFSARFDAWMTACVANRLAEMKQQQPNVPLVCTVGVYGFLEQPLKAKPGQGPNEFFQAPSLDQAKAAAVLRAGSLTDKKAFQINLSQARVEKAVWFFQGLQKGYPPAELLGRYAERLLHDNNWDFILKPLREEFPLFVRAKDEDKSRMNIIDGDKFEACGADTLRSFLIEKVAGISRDQLAAMIASGTPLVNAVDKQKMALIEAIISSVWLKTKNLKDAAADLSIAETVYQQIRGNAAKVQAWLETAEGKAVPPVPEVVETPRTGEIHTRRILLLLKAVKASGNIVSAENPRGLVEPTVAEFVRSLLPEWPDLILSISVYRREDPKQKILYGLTDIGLTKDLGLSPIDLVVGGTSLLEGCARIFLWRKLLSSPDAWDKIGMSQKEGCRTFFNSCEITLGMPPNLMARADRLQKFLRGVPAVQPRDLFLTDGPEPNADEWRKLPTEKIEMWKALRARIRQLSSKLDAVLPDDVSRLDENALQTFLLQACLWGTSGTGVPLSPESDKPAVNALWASLKIIQTALNTAKSTVNDIQTNVPVNIIDDQGKTVQGKASLTISADDNGASVSFASTTVPPGLDPDTEEKFNQQCGNLARLRFNERISSLIDVLKQCGGGEKMILLPPFSGVTRQMQSLPSDAIHELNQIRYARKTVESFYDLMQSVNTQGWNFDKLTGQTPQGETDLHILYRPEDIIPPILHGELLAGLKLDEWPDFVANKEETTGIVFRYDAPQNEAPNCLLLSVPSPDIQEWNAKNLGDTVANVIDLMRIRTLTTDDVLADPVWNQRFPILYYLNDFAKDFPSDSVVFPGTMMPLSPNTVSTDVNFFGPAAGAG
jgi:hypothetical protein